MRAARAEDFRRRAYQRRFENRVVSLKFANVPSIGTGELTFEAGPNFICGGNGVGKSSVLHGLYLSLSGDASALPPRSLQRLEGGRFDCVIATEAGEREAAVKISGGKVSQLRSVDGLDVHYLDVGPRCYRWLTSLAQMANIDELLESVEPAESNEEELIEIRYLTGKAYEAHAMYEIDEFGDDILPYPKVSVRGRQYGFEDMGLGELALNVLHWFLKRSVRRSVLFLEEPETFVSPRSQRCLMNLVCKYAVERELNILSTTHSFGVVGQFERKVVTLLHSGVPDIGVIRPPRPHQLLNVLGVNQGASALIIYEDRAACSFGSSIIERLDPDLAYSLEAQIAGDASKIGRALISLPKNQIVNLIGVYDADFEIQDDDDHCNRTNLPGSRAPESELRQLLPDLQQQVAEALKCTATDVGAAHASLEGSDDHDWLVELGKILHINLTTLVDGLVSVWLDDDGRATRARAFVAEIREFASP